MTSVGRLLKKSMVGGRSDCKTARRPSAKVMCVSIFSMASSVGKSTSCTGFLRGLWHRVKRPQQSHRMYSCTVAMIDGVNSDGVRFVEMQLKSGDPILGDATE